MAVGWSWSPLAASAHGDDRTDVVAIDPGTTPAEGLNASRRRPAHGR
jgi:hypothetical protein